MVIVTGVSSSVDTDCAVAVGLSLTALTVTVTSAVLLLSAGTPLSRTVKVKLSLP